ncbi:MULTISPECIES: AAA family ATPase [unclassified Rhizobium]|uniref:ATP-binding protein n=1 Tax=unclassified Rhizobium TaxID=2613769 RepID=UPI0007001E52|nr:MULTISPECIES: AAA family ATPase [unclassified Rhizobium]KQV43294.1 sugar translocase [Rhizobium sp. Root1212]KRD37479.1 sugar translocase [Rhizobium sp. Root268]
MRLTALDLVRYGKFTGRRIEFGAVNAGKPDFHIIYGPNEAGKSTLFSAFLDLLFGIETRSTYGFLHPYPTMRIGGVIETGGATHDVFRIKRNQNSLVDSADRPLPDTLFAAALAGIDRAAYQMMFSLDDETIERGGEAILKSEGELGALLFSASSGLPDSSAVLSRLRTEAEEFYKPQGRKHRLAELKAELETLKAEKTAADTNAREFAALRKARDVAAERHEAALSLRADIQVALERLKAQREALPLLQRLRAARSELAGFGALPEVPALWHELYPTLLREEADGDARLQQLDADIARREAELADIDEDEAALSTASTIEDIERAGLEARYRTAVYDMPSRLDERAKAAADIATRLRQLGDDAAEAENTVIPADILGRIDALSQEHGGLSERLSAAERELDAAREDFSDIEEKYPLEESDCEDLADPQALADLVRRLHRSDCLQRQQAARRDIAGLESLLSDRMAALLPFAGDVESLIALPAPPEADIAALSSEKSALEERRQRLADRIAEEEAGIAGERARLAELHRLAPLAADDAALALRVVRDEAWADHARLLDVDSAARFEAAMRRDDEAATIRLGQSESVAQTRMLTLSLAERNAKLSALQGEARTLSDRLTDWAGNVGALAAACGLPQDIGLARFERWLDMRRLALETRTALRGAMQELMLAQDDEKTALGRLSEIFEAWGGEAAMPDDLAGALDFAERRIDTLEKRIAAHRDSQQARQRASRSLEAREAAHETACDDMERWRQAWRETLAATWLGRRAELPSPTQLRPVLVLLQEIDKLAQKKADLDHRIEGMAKDQRQFATVVEEIARRLGLDGKGDVLATFEASRARLVEARRCRDLAARLRREYEERQAERQTLIEKQQRQQAQAGAILDLLGCETLVEAGPRLEAVRARDGLLRRIAETETDLCTRLSVTVSDEAELILAAVDEDGLAHALSERQASFEEADREAGNLNAERREAERALSRIGGDDAAAHLEERRRTVLAEIEARALTYLRLRTGILAGETALRLYRERHRSAMMQRASAAFSTVTGGEYEGLATQAEQGREFLIATQAGGASKLARDLSKGTRFQLYLALRMAGYHEIASTRESLPFIADDIMETFDDGRAGHAFALMGEMAKVGQVIYLTHHEHLCALAAAACPDVAIHRL